MVARYTPSSALSLTISGTRTNGSVLSRRAWRCLAICRLSRDACGPLDAVFTTTALDPASTTETCDPELPRIAMRARPAPTVTVGGAPCVRGGHRGDPAPRARIALAATPSCRLVPSMCPYRSSVRGGWYPETR